MRMNLLIVSNSKLSSWTPLIIEELKKNHNVQSVFIEDMSFDQNAFDFIVNLTDKPLPYIQELSRIRELWLGVFYYKKYYSVNAFNFSTLNNIELHILSIIDGNYIIKKKSSLKLFNHSPTRTKSLLNYALFDVFNSLMINDDSSSSDKISSLNFENKLISPVSFFVFVKVSFYKITYYSNFIKRAFLYQRWNCSHATFSLDLFLKKKDNPVENRKWLFELKYPESKADAFWLKIKNEIYIIYEKFSFTDYKGKIALSSFDLEKKVTSQEEKIILESSSHYSYPHPFLIDEKLYITPEHASSDELIAYEINNLNVQNNLRLLKGHQFVDPTLFFHNGYHYLLVGHNDNYTHGCLKTFIYYAKNMTDDWTPHPLNPVKTDMNSARSAGQVFCVDDNIIRPSQNCLKSYGSFIQLNKIIKLSPNDFSEEHYSSIYPDPVYPHGCHNISFLNANSVIIDGYISSFSPRIVFLKIKNKLSFLKFKS
jgi:hypothetical protein